MKIDRGQRGTHHAARNPLRRGFDFLRDLVLLREGRRAFIDGTLPSGLLLGLLFSLEFIFMGQSLVHTTAAHTIVFLYTAPIFTALGLRFLPDEHLSRLQWAGIGVAFFGIVVAFLGFGDRPAGELLTGDALALCAGVSWGFSNVALRRGQVAAPARRRPSFIKWRRRRSCWALMPQRLDRLESCRRR